MFGFRDLVGTSIAPVSKKAAVKIVLENERIKKNVYKVQLFSG